MDTYQGHLQLKLLEDPISLHKYLYANANTISNSDPGYFSLAEQNGVFGIIAKLLGISGPNAAAILMSLNVTLNVVFIATMKFTAIAIFVTLLTSGIIVSTTWIAEQVSTANEIKKEGKKPKGGNKPTDLKKTVKELLKR